MLVVPNKVRKFRTEFHNTQTPPWYNGWVHFCFTSFVCLGVIGYSISQIRDFTVDEILVFPLTFFYANFVEYMGHRYPMHRPMGFLKIIYERHTLHHHQFYTHEAMGFESTRDFIMVLFPPIMIVFFIGGFSIPVTLLLRELVSPNVSYIFLATGIAYYLNYEWLHWAYHLPDTHWIRNAPIFRSLLRLHTHHHDPVLMGKYNFNITYPICDWIFGTLYRKQTKPTGLSSN